MRTMEQVLLDQQLRREDREARKAQRQAKRESNRRYNQDVRDELHDNFLENQQAYHQDCIKNQYTRQNLTKIWFPGIASSAMYQTYVDHMIAKHERKIKKLDLELNGQLYGNIETVKAEIIPAESQQ